MTGTAEPHADPTAGDFAERVVAAADEAARRVGADDPDVALAVAPLGPHREAMRRVKLLVAVHLSPASAFFASTDAAALALVYSDRLRALQSPTGLFLGGDNVESPPDSGFTINDLGDVLELLRRHPDHAALQPVADTLSLIAERATPAMLAGGVHTPNHRWELAAAIARLHRHRPDPRLANRVRQWLAEGVDIDADGLYSERSANYAAHVTNPSLLAIADSTDDPELRTHLLAVVEENLTATLALIHPDRTVETVHSRRQDQKEPHFPLGPFAVHYRRFAQDRGRSDFAWAAELATIDGIVEPQTALTELLLHPGLARPLPAPAGPASASRSLWPTSGLAVDRSARRTLVVFGGSDYAAAGRVRSGLASNPTFLRMFAGDAVLESVRLSRHFFGLGPFRADGLTVSGDGFVLDETLTPAYYQPLPRERRRADGGYRLGDEGRFSAAMSFDERVRDEVPLRTRIRVQPTEDGVELTVETEGPLCTWSIELAFRPGGVFEGVTPEADGTAVLTTGTARYRVGNSVIAFGPGTGTGGRGGYHPGEDYTYLGGSDALGGPRVYVTGSVPGRSTLQIRRAD